MDLSRISCYEERLCCMMLKTMVSDCLSEIGQKLTNFRLVCEVSTVLFKSNANKIHEFQGFPTKMNKILLRMKIQRTFLKFVYLEIKCKSTI